MFGIATLRGAASGCACTPRHTMSSTPPWVNTATRAPACAGGQRLQRRAHAVEEAAAALTAGRCAVGVVPQPGLPLLRVAQAQRGAVQAFEHPEGLLAPGGVGGQRQPALRRQGLGGLAGTLQVAADQQVDRLVGQPRGQPGGLGASDRVQRHVDMALDAQLAVVVGLGVADQEQLDHSPIVRAGR